MGTPHHGSALYKIALTMGRIARLAGNHRDLGLLKELVHAESLAEINEEFMYLMEKRNLGVWSFLEGLATKPFNQLVSK